MAIIYTYPTKATLATSDLILISDSADGNKTKNATVTSIKDAIDVVDSAASGSGISITGQGSGPYTGAITIANTGVLSFSNAFGTYITGTTNTSATGNASIGTLDLSAIDGVDASNRFLSKDNVWSTVVGVVGPGTTNKIPKFATTTTLGDSIMAEQAAAGVFASSYIEISGTGGLSTQDLEINAALWDGSASKGTSGQLLSSTGTETSWIAPPAAGAQGQVQYNDNPNLAGSANMTFTDSGSTALFQVRNIVQVRGGGGNAGVLKLWSTDDVTRVELQGPPTGGANYSLAMPASVGTANQVLKLPSTIPGSGSSQLVWGDATGGSTYTLQAEAKSGTSVPLKLDASSGTDSTVNLKEGTNITLTRNSSSEITIASTSGGGGISPFPIYQAKDSVAVGAQTIIRQSVCETAGTYSKLEYFSIGAASYPVYFAIYAGTITAAGSAVKRLEGFNSTQAAGINVINFTGSYNFTAGQDIVIVVSANDTVGLAGSNTLLNHVDISRGSAVYTSSFPSSLSSLLDSIPNSVATGVCTHIY